MARMVATKAALSIRVDALTDADGKSEPTAPSIGIQNRGKLESRLRALEHQLEGGTVRRFAGENSGKKQQKFEMTRETKTYNTAADHVDLIPTQRESPSSAEEAALQVILNVKEEKRKAKEERKARKNAEKEKEKESSREVEGDEHGGSDEDPMEVDGEPDKKDKKRKRRESDQRRAIPMDEDEPEETATKVFLSSVGFFLSVTFFFYQRKRQRRERQEERQRKRRKLQLPSPPPLARGEVEIPPKKRKRSRRREVLEVNLIAVTYLLTLSVFYTGQKHQTFENSNRPWMHRSTSI